jgi:hypothetical protein
VSRQTRAIALLLILTILLLGAVLLAGPPGDDTLALRRFLSASGVDVSTRTTPPDPPATFVLMEDLRDETEAADLLRWVELGGRLVVADPQSRTLDLMRIGIGDPIGLVGTRTLSPSCAAAEVVGVDELVVDAGDATLRSSSAAGVACFVRPGGSFLVVAELGAGHVVVLGGSSPLRNDLLDRGDNAELALRLASGGPVVFGPPVGPRATSPGLWELLPGGARLVIVQIVVATVLFAIARARRLGRPVLEEPLAPIAAGELVGASAGLYRQARAAGFCGELLRRSAVERLSRRMGAAQDAPPSALAAVVSASSGLSRERVEAAIAGPEPSTDEELLALAGELAAITRQVEGGRR